MSVSLTETLFTIVKETKPTVYSSPRLLSDKHTQWSIDQHIVLKGPTETVIVNLESSLQMAINKQLNYIDFNGRCDWDLWEACRIMQSSSGLLT